MTRFFIVVGLIVVCVAGLAYYLGYFRIGSESGDGETHFQLTVDQEKIQTDQKRAVERLQGKE